MQKLITTKHSYYILHIFFRQHVSAQYGHRKTNNMKFLKVTVHNCVKSYSDLNLFYVDLSD